MTKFQQKASSMFLLMIALSDIIILWLGLLPHWLMKHYKQPEPWADMLITCKFITLVFSWATQFGAWLHVGIAIERFCITCFPFYYEGRITREVIIIVVSILGGVLFYLNIHLVYISTSIQRNGRTYTESINWIYCINSKIHSNFFTREWPYVEFTFTSLIPCVLLVIFNVMIVLGHQHEKHRKVKEARKPLSGMTWICLVISLWYLVTTFPGSLNFVILRITKNQNFLPNNPKVGSFLYSLGLFSVYLNSTCNVIICYLCSKTFKSKINSRILRNIGRIRKIIRN